MNKKYTAYFLFYRYKNKPHHELRELLQAFSSSFMIQDVYENLEEIVDGNSHTISKIFNAFLIIELIPATDGQEIEIYSLYDEKDIAINILKKALEDLEINDLSVFIKQEDKSLVKPLLSKNARKDKGIFWIGLCLPVSLLSDHKSDSLPEHLTDAFKKVVFTFIRIQISNHFSHYLMHDNDKLEKDVEKIDQELADISD